MNLEGQPEAPNEMEPEAEYRGFLFADLRGYTDYVERAGDRAAADLLDAYRALVRAEVARHAGAEIKTEGDSFYVVFRSARRAVACALSIVEAAERDHAEHPERPIRIGIGINAGETVQRGEGFVGTAVNLAARVCAHAREGEVLTTAAVRDAVGAGAGVRFTHRGTRRLKGITRPVPLFTVESEATRPATAIGGVGTLGPWLVAGSVVVLAIAVGTVIGSGMLGASLPPGASADATDPTLAPTSATPSASAMAAPTVADEFPNDAEKELLARFDESVSDDCERADIDDRPRFNLGEEGNPVYGRGPREPIQIDAGLECEIASFGAPDLVLLWATRRTMDYVPADVPEALIFNRAGALGIPRGNCSTQSVAFDAWSFGDLGGLLLCRADQGDAIIEWSYDDQPILGMAVRRDGDLASLLAWWREEARLIAP